MGLRPVGDLRVDPTPNRRIRRIREIDDVHATGIHRDENGSRVALRDHRPIAVPLGFDEGEQLSAPCPADLVDRPHLPVHRAS